MMPKCGECGAFFEGDGWTCPICGTTVTAGTTDRIRSEQSEMARIDAQRVASLGKDTIATKASEASFPQTDAGGPENAADRAMEFEMQLEVGSASETGSREGSAAAERGFDDVPGHLGKGLIKPQVKALEPDGYHFRYDEPKLNFVKTDYLQEKTAEFRVSGEDMEKLKEIKALETDQSSVPSPEDTEVKETGPELSETPGSGGAGAVSATEMQDNVGETELPIAPGTVTPESGSQSEAENIGETEAETISAENAEAVTPDLTPAAEGELGPAENEILPEPELVVEPEAETLWTGVRTRYGFASKDGYRITNREIRALGSYGQTLDTVEISAVTAVRAERPFPGRLFGVGDVQIYTRNAVTPVLTLKSVKEPAKVQRLLEELIRVR